MESRDLPIPDALLGQRLDKALVALCPDLSRARLQGLINSGHVALDGAALKDVSYKLKHSGTLTLTIPPEVPVNINAEAHALDILHEDEHLLVLNKPAGMVVHPGAGNAEHTLVNYLLAHCGAENLSISGEQRPGIVHRLDKDTSGVMVIAKNDAAHRDLTEQFQSRTIERAYQAVCLGHPQPQQGLYQGNIGRHPQHRQKMAVLKTGGREAITRYAVKEYLPYTLSLVEFRLLTGRTHQIRVHAAHHGHPLIGDPVYARSLLSAKYPEIVRKFPRQALHAFVLGFVHPVTGETLRFTSPLPADFQELLQSVRPSV